MQQRDPVIDALTNSDADGNNSPEDTMENGSGSQEAAPAGTKLTENERRRSKGARGAFAGFLSFLMTALLIFGCLLLYFVWQGQEQFDAPGPLAQDTTYEVKRGATFSSIIPDLEAKKIIPEQNMLRVFLRNVQAAGKAVDLKAGEFAFQPGMSMREVMLQLTEGRAVSYRITIPEGWTSYRAMERVQFHPDLTGELPSIPPEGAILPDTYTFPRGTPRKDVVERMMAAQKKALDEAWESRAQNLPLKNKQEMLILASIVEKETGVSSERPHVASVFVNRLRKGMKLQTDPTVIYGIWGGQGKPKDRGGLRRSELDRATPYNTYSIQGLPPTPIANPGRAALEAVANPLETDDLFFVADGTGGHAFAKTLAGHNANVRKWRKIEAGRRKQREAEEAAAEAEAKAKAKENSGLRTGSDN